jgi:hypothetical protein
VLHYNTSTFEIAYDTAKSFVIPHPESPTEDYLVHACLEGPEAGVYYRGKGEIREGQEKVTIVLPSYTKAWFDMTTHVSMVYNGVKGREIYSTAIAPGEDRFDVYGSPGPFTWTVFGTRLRIETEVSMSDVHVRGNGPYTYIVKKDGWPLL